MNFKSTRGKERGIKSAEAIIRGIASDGGLFVPDNFPKIYEEAINKKGASYEELAYFIIGKFFTDFKLKELKSAVKEAYTNRFAVNVEKNFLELYHGPTCAFKDAALLFLPQIMKRAKKNLNVDEEIVILTATSGDTGKAALEGFKDIEGFKVVVYYPQDGVSEIQKKQMISQEGTNVYVVAIEGNFDNAQQGVKEIFKNEKLKEDLLKNKIRLSSANSINIGRLIPQIVYYFYGYMELIENKRIKEGEKINVSVPTGNFGNILAAFYAKKMGLPIDKLICASNENNVLSNFLKTGIYDRRRDLIITESPSMDILVSSNLERLLYEVSGRNYKLVGELMNNLASNGLYEITREMKEGLKEFYGNFSTTEEVYKAVQEVYVKDGYLMDTHTGVAYVVHKKYIEETGDNKETLIVSTASPFKFPRSICTSLGIDVEFMDDFRVLKTLFRESKNEIPESLKTLENKKIMHTTACKIDGMEETLKYYLGVNK
ncbi:threonine synthase [uncultured Clostridium sp.]|uniref:threonine synthase n=1 Tax=uncultured Clostridium sp. TaxID=59620 RepID=UPI00262EC9B6|nr:threonine synthase [uncultured Clostridium sp.]